MILKGIRHVYDDKAIFIVSLIATTALAWVYLVQMAAMASAMPMDRGFQPLAIFVMWTVMMIGMMLPTAMPGILAYAAAERRRYGKLTSMPYLVALGYVLAWALFSLVATGAQWGLNELAMLSPLNSLNNPVLAGGLLIVAGLFQYTPMKSACLRYCRSPLGMLAQGLPGSASSSLGTGMHIGLYCIGCCWALMILMFVGGVMSLFWMALLTIIMFLEKVVGKWRQFSTLCGFALVAYGVYLIVQAFVLHR